MSLTIHPQIFREYDIRGIAEKDLNASFAKALGLTYASYATARLPGKKITVSVGRDCRLTGESYAEALIEGLVQGGIHVVRLGVCPTPLTYFSVFHLDLDGGIMVTGSHNPAEYNGFKVCFGKDTLHGSQIQELRKIMEKNATTLDSFNSSKKGTVSDFAIIPAYLDYLSTQTKKRNPKLKPLKIVLDAGNGTAATVAPPLFESLGAKIIPLFCELDGRFPNHHPDPTVPENLKDLVETIKREKADFGVAFDGDSDRIGLVDENGRIIFGDELMVILARAVLKENPGATIISEVKSSNRLYDQIALAGGKPLMWKTGHSLIKSKMKETGALLAGEMSGHIFFADRYFGYDDAIYAAVRVYEIASDHSGPVSSLLKGLPPAIATPEIRVECEEEKKFLLVEETKKILSIGRKTIDIDGVRVDFGDAWGLVRASNTQPVLVLRFEAVSEARLKEVRSIVESALRQAAEKIQHAPLF